MPEIPHPLNSVDERWEVCNGWEAGKKSGVAVRRFKERRDPQKVQAGIERLKKAAFEGDNVFEVTLATVEEITLDEWTHALQEVYGMYRRKI